jgi:hypothetical protein
MTCEVVETYNSGPRDYEEEDQHDMPDLTVPMDHMELHDILHHILYSEIVNHNEMGNLDYFKTRLENEPITDELKNDALCILDKMTDDFEDLVHIVQTENQEKRRENLNSLVSLCEKIVGV